MHLMKHKSSTTKFFFWRESTKVRTIPKHADMIDLIIKIISTESPLKKL